MAETRSSARRKRYVVVAVGVAIVVGLAGFVAAAGAPEPRLPHTTPPRLVSSMAGAILAMEPVSGWVTMRVDLGLPDLPQASSGGGPLSFAGDHRLRVWHSPLGLRVTDVLPLAERSVVAGPDGVWTWDSETFSARRLAGPEAADVTRDLGGLLSLLDPVALASASLDGISGSTKVGLGRPTTVAGRAAYVLELRPRSEATLVDRVEIAIDERARVPLAVEVYGDGLQRSSISARFESVSFDEIPRSIFEFSPPPGARISKGTPQLWSGAGTEGSSDGDHEAGRGPTTENKRSGLGGAKVFGRGWASVFALPLPTGEASDRPGDVPSPEALTPFSGPLFSADIIEASAQRWLVVGAVPLERLRLVGGRLE